MDYGFDVEGRVAVVTGGGTGIGAALADGFLQCGAKVIIADRVLPKDDRIDDARVLAVEMDVADPGSVAAMLNRAVERFGTVHVLVNNAGVIYKAPVEEIDVDRWKEVLAVNLTGPMVCTRAVVPLMKAQSWGRVINISSMQALIGTPTYSAYSATKAAVSELTKVWAAELAPHGITVNAICPSYVETPMMERSVARAAVEQGIDTATALARFLESIPQGRLLRREEIAFHALYLASSLAEGVTGHDLVVAAGMVLH